MIFILFIYSLISFIILFSVSKISYELNLLDIPKKRKVHLTPTAHTGGIALCIIYIFAVFLFNFSNQKLDLVLTFAFFMGIIGSIDDRYNLNVAGKLSLQIILTLYFILLENYNLNSLGSYNTINFQLNSFSIPFTLFSILILINAFNYFDGLDGTLSFSIISTICILIFLLPKNNIQLFLIVLLIPILFFLSFNFCLLGLPKLFLGDGGSLSLGFIISFTLIYLANQSIVHPILLAFSISVFVYEFLSINIIRIMNKKKLFNAGKDHLHHILYKKNKSIFLTNFLIFFINILCFIFGYLSFNLINPLGSMASFIILFIFYFKLRKNFNLK